jgi:hypothetical protein
VPTRFERLRVARLSRQPNAVGALLAMAGTPTQIEDDAAVRSALATAVPEYKVSDRNPVT